MDVKLLGCLTELIIILTKVSDEAGIIAFCKSPNSDWHNAKLMVNTEHKERIDVFFNL